MQNPNEDEDMARLSADDIARIADRVSQVMQLDRTRHHVSSAPDLAAQVNIPAYLARIFEQAGSVSGAISNEALYDLVNKRIARLEASLYLARVELENRSAHEPSEIYADPMMVSAYAERVSHATSLPRSYSFEPSVLAHGWYPVESVGEHYHRWMRPMDESALACLPHLGQIDQVIEIEGRVLHADQLENLSIKFGDIAATITQKDEMPEQFVATLALSAQDVAHSNYVAIAFDMTDFRQPNEADTRLLGINLRRFTCRPEAQAE